MPVCPECGNAHLAQLEDKYTMVCGAGHFFLLLRIPSEHLDKSYADRLIPLLVKIAELLWRFGEVIKNGTT